MATIEELQEVINGLKEENEDLQQRLTDAELDSEEAGTLKEELKQAKEKLQAATGELDTVKAESKKTAFAQKKKGAIASIGLREDHPAVKLAFPDDEPMDDEMFASRMNSLEEIAKASKEPEGGDEGDPEADKWKKFGGAPASESEIRGDEATTEMRKNADAAKKKALKTGDIGDLLPAVMGKIKQVVKVKRPSGESHYEIHDTGRFVGPGGRE